MSPDVNDDLMSFEVPGRQSDQGNGSSQSVDDHDSLLVWVVNQIFLS